MSSWLQRGVSRRDLGALERNDPSFTVLNLNLTLRDEASEALCVAEALKSNTCVKRIELQDNFLSSGSVIALCDAIRASQTTALVAVDLSGNQSCGDAAATAISHLIRYSSIQKLYIGSCGLSDEGLSLIFGALRNNHTLTTLDVRFNRLRRPETVGILHDSLQANVSLSDLDLRRCGIGDEALQELPSTHRLQSLWLDENQFGERGVDVLAMGLAQDDSRLRLLSLFGNAGIRDASVFFWALEYNSTLVHLDLRLAPVSLYIQHALDRICLQNRKKNPRRLRHVRCNCWERELDTVWRPRLSQLKMEGSPIPALWPYILSRPSRKVAADTIFHVLRQNTDILKR